MAREEGGSAPHEVVLIAVPEPESSGFEPHVERIHLGRGSPVLLPGPGPWTLRFFAKGLAPIKRRVLVRADEVLDLGELVAGSGRTVSGVVVDARGAPVEGARILTPLEELADRVGVGVVHDVVTDALGGFRVSGLETGPTHLLVASRDHPVERVGLTHDSVGAPLRIVLRDGGRVSIVARLPDGRGLARLRVRVFELGTSAPVAERYCDLRGMASLNLAPGRYVLEASHPQFGRARQEIGVTIGETTEAKLVLR